MSYPFMKHSITTHPIAQRISCTPSHQCPSHPQVIYTFSLPTMRPPLAPLGINRLRPTINLQPLLRHISILQKLEREVHKIYQIVSIIVSCMGQVVEGRFTYVP